MTARILRRRGYEVLLADSVESAIHLATSHPGRIDLLLSGGKPGQMSGGAARAAIALTRPDVRLLLVSGHGDDSAPATSDRDIAVLRKPYTADELLAKVSEVLGQSCLTPSLGGS